jgi:hypothetical protein
MVSSIFDRSIEGLGMLDYRLALALCASVLAGEGCAQTIIECSGSAGKAYYFDIEPQTGEPTGWIDDGISDGSVVFVRNGDAFDIIIRDAIGTISATAEGARVSVIDVRDPFVEVLVSYPQGPKELYTFDLKERRLVWSQHKFGVMFDKASTFVAECK